MSIFLVALAFYLSRILILSCKFLFYLHKFSYRCEVYQLQHKANQLVD